MPAVGWAIQEERLHFGSHQTLALLARKLLLFHHILKSPVSLHFTHKFFSTKQGVPDKVICGTEHTIVLNAKSGQSDIWDEHTIVLSAKSINLDKCSPTSPTWPWSPRRGPSTSPLSSLGQVTLVDQFLAFRNVLSWSYGSGSNVERSGTLRAYKQTDKRSRHICIDLDTRDFS